MSGEGRDVSPFYEEVKRLVRAARCAATALEDEQSAAGSDAETHPVYVRHAETLAELRAALALVEHYYELDARFKNK